MSSPKPDPAPAPPSLPRAFGLAAPILAVANMLISYVANLGLGPYAYALLVVYAVLGCLFYLVPRHAAAWDVVRHSTEANLKQIVITMRVFIYATLVAMPLSVVLTSPVVLRQVPDEIEHFVATTFGATGATRIRYYVVPFPEGLPAEVTAVFVDATDIRLNYVRNGQSATVNVIRMRAMLDKVMQDYFIKRVLSFNSFVAAFSFVFIFVLLICEVLGEMSRRTKAVRDMPPTPAALPS